MNSVLLTGATGFIGQRLQTALLANGKQLTAVVRPSSANKDQLLCGVHSIVADLSNTDILASAIADCDAVIYCAGSVRGRNLEDFRAANISGVRSVVDAMNQDGSETPLLLISSLAASRSRVSDYANSKFLGEREVIQHSRFPWTIFRPPAVYGRGDREILPLLKLARRGIVIPAGPVRQKFSLIHVDDLAAAVLAWLDSWPACLEQTFSLDDGHSGGHDWREVAETASGGKYYSFRIPSRLLFAAAKTNLLLSGLFGYAPMLSPGKARELIQADWLCDNDSLTRASGWTPAIDLENGLKKTFAHQEKQNSET
ncbi:MAG: NAD-dependent epimerase/dehydratase family protein [Xanthomonadales bacterium]